MDPTADFQSPNPPGSHSDGAAFKRPIENLEDDELAVRLPKKPRCGPGDLKRVAEIVLVLSTMAAMRGAKNPTAAELGLMAEARAILAEMCQSFAPKEIVAREAIESVIEDLGLNWKVKDQRLGLRAPKLSISEKLELTTRKMEESKKFAAASVTCNSHPLQTSIGAAAESCGTPNTVRTFPSDKPSQAPISSPLGHVSATTSTSLSYQLSNSDVRASMVSSGLPGGHLGRDSSSLAVPRVERTQFKLDGGSNGSSYGSQVQANSSANHPLVNAPTWSIQPQSISSAKTGPENKVHNSGKVEGTADASMSQMAPQAARDQTFRPFITQTASGNFPSMHQPLQGMNFVQAPRPVFNHHSEIAKIVQKLLQPQLPEHPTWTPPSRDYMSKPLTCQACKLTINEVESVLLCDACEKGYHLKCLQSYNQKGIPRGEWHCIKCLTLSAGKPLPPKYGRVMRNINTPKLPSNVAGVQLSSEKKVGTLDPKVNQQNIIANGSSGLQSPACTGSMGSNYFEATSDTRIPDASVVQGSKISSSRINMDEKPLTSPNIPVKFLGATSGSPSVDSSSERSTQHIQISESSKGKDIPFSESKSQRPAKLSNTVSYKSDHLQPSDNPQDDDRTGLRNCAEVPSKHNNSHMVKDSEKSHIRENSDCISRYDSKHDDQDIAQVNPAGSSGISTGPGGLAGFSSDGLHGVKWIGDVLKVVDGKKFYESCCTNGVTYTVQDHALFRSSHDKLIPSKLQAMWEDSNTGSKWVIVNRCYFPGDLPEVVNHPCTPESNEVYGSNHDSTIMAGLIQGPCEVLPPAKFKEESERRSQLETEANNGIRPVFQCKWFYDEFKGLFQPVSS